MNRFATTVALFVVFAALPAAHADTAVVPVAFAAIEGDQGVTSLISSTDFVCQQILDHALLSAIPDNAAITGISFRLNEGSFGSAKSFADYEIRLGASSVVAASSSDTLASNFVGGNAGRTLVRDGTLSFNATYFPNSGIPRAFAAPFSFSTPYVYDKDAGAGLVIEIRHTGGGGTGFADAQTSVTGAQYRSTNNNTATIATATSIPIIELTYTVVPEASAGILVLVGVGCSLLGVMRRRAVAFRC